ncbi:MAG: c-type cytochrome [Planctomycetota bacterium]
MPIAESPCRTNYPQPCVPGWFALFSRLAPVLLTAAITAAAPVAAQAPQDLDPDEAIPGLALELQSGQTVLQQSVIRPVLQTTSGRLDPRLHPDSAASFRGQLLVRSGGPHRFHVQLSGQVTIVVDEQTLLDVSGEDRFFSSDPVMLGGDEHSLRIRYRPPSSSEGLLQVFWSAPDFTLEPLPADVLSRFPDSAAEMASQHSSAGRFTADALRCGACHAGWSEGPVVPAPSLTDTLPWRTDNQLAARLLRGTPDSAMPHFNFTPGETADAIAFLRSTITESAPQPALPAAPAFKPGDAAAGEKLLLTTGCAACHLIDPQVKAGIGPWGGPDLRDGSVGRTAAWLLQWLKDPQLLNRHQRMPVFEFTDDERRQLVAALLERQSATMAAKPSTAATAVARSSGPDEVALPQGDVQRGRTLVQAAGCAACHHINGINSPPLRPFQKWPASGSRIPCFDNAVSTAAGSDAPRPGTSNTSSSIASTPVVPISPRAVTRAPRFVLSEIRQQEIAAWQASLTQPLPVATGHELGRLLLQRRSCLACHDRDGTQGLSEIAARLEERRDDLRGQAQALIPPELTAVGDRLRDEVLGDAVNGGVERRLPWLLVRMPRFRHSPAERDALVRLFITEDRIPDAADAARQELFESVNPQHPTLATPEELYSGNQLAGAGGFQCTACHKAGPWEPRNVALGTRGSDLMLMGRRLRSRYFLRWMHNPIRVVPGIEMPQLRKPVDRGFNETLSGQIGQLWTALADSRFVPPTVTSRYEQVVAVSKGSRPRVIRDVFLGEGNPVGSGTARAFAVGFDNGHNLLFDLDSGRLVQWTAGEFARQRTEGKSWFWDLAGVSLAAFGRATEPGPFRLLMPETDEPLSPVRDESRTAELLSIEETATHVVVRLRLHYATAPVAAAAAPSDVATAAAPHSAVTAWTARPGLRTAILRISVSALAVPAAAITPAVTTSAAGTGVEIEYLLESAPDGSTLLCESADLPPRSDGLAISQEFLQSGTSDVPAAPTGTNKPLSLQSGQRLLRRLSTRLPAVPFSPPAVPPLITEPVAVNCVPGFVGTRLALPAGLMPTGMAWFADGRMAVSSLRGEVRILRDRDGDGKYDTADVFADGLAAPYGVLVDGADVLVAHKPELLRLRDMDGDGRADVSQVLASGWGFSDDYHDWTSGLTRDAEGNLYVGLGSDYSQNKRSPDNDRWRGTILKIDPTGRMEPIAFSMRFPMGLAFDAHGRLFATDNQGVQNTFNEVNHILTGRRYGVPSRYDQPDREPESPALQIPHPWTRSVNSLAFIPEDYPVAALRGQAVGCEYDTQCLIRMSFEEVNGVVQGACYRFSRLPEPGMEADLQGPISVAFAPDHTLYIGSLRDSGWQGARNTGCIERLSPVGELPNGIREIRAVADGFQVEFFAPLPADTGTRPEDWDLQSFTRVWKGSYATADSERRSEDVTEVRHSADGQSVHLKTGGHRAGFLYEVRLKATGNAGDLWPVEGFYWMKQTPG